MEITTEVSSDVEKLLSLDKQIRFATAKTLTDVAKEAQSASIEAIQEHFITRNNWYLPSNRYGVHIEPATKENLQSAVKTDAYWLRPHETGEDKIPHHSQNIAVPTRNARPNPRQIIPSSLKPRNLVNAFVIKTRRGPVLFQRVGKLLVPLYGLEKRVSIRRESTVIEPTMKTVEQRLGKIFFENLRKALETAK
ncbi:MAG TPA: hypothetical protein VF735_06640 [Pyrinomonadaceae bacterium]|jgi:hypothetical protein